MKNTETTYVTSNGPQTCLMEATTKQASLFFKLKKIGRTFICTEADGELFKQFGCGPEHMKGKKLEEIVPEHLLEFKIESYNKVWNGESLSYEGNYAGIPYLTAISPIRQDGKVIEIIGFCLDITEKKQKEKELIATKEYLEALFTNSADAITITNFEDNSVRVNPAFEKIYGWKQEDLSNRKSPIMPIVPEWDLEDALRLTTLVAQGVQIKNYEAVRIHKNGTPINSSLTLSPIFNEEGQITAFSVISRDITKSKQREEALKESEEKYRIIAENTTDLICVIDVYGKINYASPSIKTILGYEANEQIGKQSFDFFHPDDIDQLTSLLGNLMHTKKPVKLEVRCKHADGKWVFLEASVTPVVGEDCRINSIVVVARDITDRKKTEEMLRKSDKLSVLGQLAAGVAHEIRNPLTSIKGFLQLLQSTATENRDYFEIMLSEIDRINGIVSEFMLLSKPQVLNFTLTNISTLIEHVISLIKTQAILMNVQIYYHYQSDLPSILCVEDQMKQVFINLLKNAIEAMPDGGNVYINVKQADNELVISFKDEGCGIPPNRLKTLGEPFYTTKEKGTGLGLMICFKIIENHGGKIHISSEIGKGSIFSIHLPIKGQSS
ncbi:PAS domain S-box protein [Fictibacillus gelatini]|uniref:PAS domain S-box protein n=1 Tax=Fictibacillus gelatini TaxID=225985 RepID=UPI00040841A4|nr:PAS domain S-box protein [Fictibacillus gelatini]